MMDLATGCCTCQKPTNCRGRFAGQLELSSCISELKPTWPEEVHFAEFAQHLPQLSPDICVLLPL